MGRQVRNIFSTSDNIDHFEYEDREYEKNFIFGLEHTLAVLALIPPNIEKALAGLQCRHLHPFAHFTFIVLDIRYICTSTRAAGAASSQQRISAPRGKRPLPAPPVLNNAHDLHAQEQFHKKNGDDMSGEAGSSCSNFKSSRRVRACACPGYFPPILGKKTTCLAHFSPGFALKISHCMDFRCLLE
jgi:hypothetical protein